MAAVRSSVHHLPTSGRSVTIWEVIAAGFSVLIGVAIAVLVLIKIYSVCKRSLKCAKAKNHQNSLAVTKKQSKSCPLALVLLKSPGETARKVDRFSQLEEDSGPAAKRAVDGFKYVESNASVLKAFEKRQSNKSQGKSEGDECGIGKKVRENKTIKEAELSGTPTAVNTPGTKIISDISEIKIKHQFENEKKRLVCDLSKFKS